MNNVNNIKLMIIMRFLTVLVTITALVVSFVHTQNTAWCIVKWTLSAVALIALLVTSAFDRNFYLRFLNRGVFPTGLLDKVVIQHVNSPFSTTVNLNGTEGSYVVYWASHPGQYETPYDAYKRYTNAAVTKIGKNGITTIKLDQKPGTYKVPMKGTLQPHIHYRIMEHDGMLGEVQTLYV